MKNQSLENFWENVFCPYLNILTISLKNYWNFQRAIPKMKVLSEYFIEGKLERFIYVENARNFFENDLIKHLLDYEGNGCFSCWIWINFESGRLCIQYEQLISVDFSDGFYTIKNKGDIGILKYTNSQGSNISLNHLDKIIQFTIVDSWSTMLDSYQEVFHVFDSVKDWFFEFDLDYDFIKLVKSQIDDWAEFYLEKIVFRIIKNLKKIDKSFGFYGKKYTTWDCYCISVQKSKWDYIEIYEYDVWRAINLVYSFLKFDSLFLLSYLSQEKDMYRKKKYIAPNETYESEVLELIHSKVLELAHNEVNRNIRREIDP